MFVRLLYAPVPRPLRGLAITYLVVIFAAAAFWAWRAQLQLHEWLVGDWLINYSAGFVRRGVCGQLLLWLQAFGIPSLLTLAVIKATAMLVILAVLLRMLLRSPGLSRVSTVLLLSPAGFAFWGLNPSGGSRKELLLIAWFMTLLWRATNPNALALGGMRAPRALEMAAGFFLLTLAHEGLLMFSPLVLIAVAVLARESLPLVRYALAMAPAIFVFIAGLPSVSPADPEAICKSIQALDPMDCGAMFWPEGAVSYLSVSAAASKVWVWGRVCADGGLILLPIALGYGGVGLAWASFPGKRLANRGNRRAIGLLAIPAVLGLALLLAYALDWGRWIFVPTVILASTLAAREWQCAAVDGQSELARTPVAASPYLRALVIAASLWLLLGWRMNVYPPELFQSGGALDGLFLALTDRR